MQCIANCKYCFQMFLGLSVTDWTARSIFKACERIKDLVTTNFYSYKSWEKVEPFNRAKVVTGWFLSRVENSVGGRTRMPAWHVWHPCGCAQASHPRATAVGTRLHLRPVETAFGEWSLFPFCCQPTPAAFLTNLQPAEIQQASWHKDFITSSLNLYFTGWISLLKNTSRSVKTSQSLSMSGQNRMIFLFSRQFSYTQAKLTSCIFQLSCCIRGLCQLSVLFNLGQQDTDSSVADTVVFLHLLNIALFHAFCYWQQPYHGSNESPVLVICQWWAKLHDLYNLLLSKCCRCDLWMPLISMAFMKLTGWDEIAFCCARSLLWDKRANSPGEFICQSHLWLEWNKKLMLLKEGEGTQRSSLWCFCMISRPLFTCTNEEWSLERFSLMLLMPEAALQNK